MSLSIGISVDGKKWNRILNLESLTPTSGKEGEEYSYPTIIQSANGRVHIVYTWNSETVKHVVLDPEQIN